MAPLFTRLYRARDTLKLTFSSAPAASSALIVLTLCGAVLPVVVAYVGKAIVDAVVAHDRGQALRWVEIELAMMILTVGVQRAAGLMRSLVGTRLALSVNAQILGKALTLELRHFQDPEFYDQLTRARREAASRPLAMVTELLSIAQAGLLLFGFVGLLFSFSSLAVVVLIAAALPAAVAEVKYSRAVFALRNSRAPETRRLGYLEYILASDEHAKEVMTLGLGPMLLERYRTLGQEVFHEDRALLVRRTLWGTFLSQLGTLSFYGCYLFIVTMAAAGRISLGQMTLYIVAFRQGQQCFQASLLSIGALYEHDLYMSNLLDFLNLRTERRAMPQLPASTATERGIRFSGVGFCYPDQERFALRDINLFIPSGRSLALVGQNGAGKSTFIKLLTGLYTPTEGQIFIDGVDIAALPRDVLRQRIAVVFQDFNQYQFSARENVGFGSPTHLADGERIERALVRGGADFVRELPEGADTQLGRFFQKGVELSGGQWQRIALARAFMREEADILILDEPTAALDAEAERELFERFRTLSQGRTALLISHRFPTVRMADHIVVLEQSRIIEQGTHDTLLEQNGQYASMFQLQAQGYR